MSAGFKSTCPIYIWAPLQAVHQAGLFYYSPTTCKGRGGGSMPPNAGWETALPNIRGLDGTIVPEDIVGGGAPVRAENLPI